MSETISGPRAPRYRVALLVQAWLLLIVGTFLQRAVPMTWWGSLLGTPGPVPDSQPTTLLGSEETNSRHNELKEAIYRASRALPWKPSCLARAFTGQRILLSWNIPGEVVIGLKPEGNAHWPAHAWLISRRETIIGELEKEGFFPATLFRLSGHSTVPTATSAKD